MGWGFGTFNPKPIKKNYFLLWSNIKFNLEFNIEVHIPLLSVVIVVADNDLVNNWLDFADVPLVCGACMSPTYLSQKC